MQAGQSKAGRETGRIDIVVFLFLWIARNDNDTVANVEAVGPITQRGYFAGRIGTKNVWNLSTSKSPNSRIIAAFIFVTSISQVLDTLRHTLRRLGKQGTPDDLCDKLGN